MSNKQYSEDEIKDIRGREAEALEYLKTMKLNLACMPQLVNIGNDTFAVKLHPFLQDTKYTATVSPIQA